MKEKLQLFVALLVAALGFLRANPRESRLRLKSALRVWWSRTQPDALENPEISEKHLATCRKCLIFYAPLQTCGSPLKKELRGLGCWCHMPTAVKLKNKECWLDELAERDGGDLHPHSWKSNP